MQTHHISTSLTPTVLETLAGLYFLSEVSICCTLFKYLFPFVEGSLILRRTFFFFFFFIQAVNIDCHRGRERGGSISITAFHYMADDSRAECASSMQPRNLGYYQIDSDSN